MLRQATAGERGKAAAVLEEVEEMLQVFTGVYRCLQVLTVVSVWCTEVYSGSILGGR